MKTLLYSCITLKIAILPLQAEGYENPHDYVKDGLNSWSEKYKDGSSFYDEVFKKLQIIKSVLPSSEEPLKAQIDSGIAALEKMRDAKDDSDIMDLANMAAGISAYYFSHAAEISESPESELSRAFFTLDPEMPPRFFQQYLMGRIFNYYTSYYKPEQIPENVKNAMVKSLEWLTHGADGELEGLNLDLIYYFVHFWDKVEPKLATMPAARKKLILDELEIYITSYDDDYPEKILAAARANLAKAREN